jgi:DNA-binding beta-propeller fold protein YncE
MKNLLLSLFLLFPFLILAHSWNGHILNHGSSSKPSNLSIYTDTHTVQASLPITNRPLNMAIYYPPDSPHSPIGYIISSSHQPIITIIDLISQNILTPIHLGAGKIIDIAIDSINSTAYVATWNEESQGGEIKVINLLTNEATSSFSVFAPKSLALSTLNNNPVLYVSSLDGTLHPFIISGIPTNPTLQALTPIPLLAPPNYTPPYKVVLNFKDPSGYPTAYITTPSFSLTSINLTNNTVQPPISLESKLTGGIAITEDGKKAYVTTLNGVSVIELATRTIQNIILPSTNYEVQVPQDIAITPDGKYAYVALNNTDGAFEIYPGEVALIDMSTHSPIKIFSSEGYCPIKIIFSSTTQTEVLNVHPTVGSTFGETPVTLTGRGFNGTTAVLFGSIPAKFSQVSDDTIIAISPPGSLNTTVPITVLTDRVKSGTSSDCCHTYVLTLFPPTNLQGSQVKNPALTKVERINIIHWNPPIYGTQPIAYKIYRDRDLRNLITTIPASETCQFKDYKRKKQPYTYFITSIDQAGHQSTAESITIKPK